MTENEDCLSKNVLIVDDETPFTESLQTGLEAKNSSYKIVTAENGKAALEILDKTTVDLVVTDLRMPEMDGFELLSELSINFPSIPIIVMSAYGTQEIKDRLRRKDTIEFLEKPFDFKSLKEAIEKGLRRESDGGALRGISIANFLQLIEMEKKTCLLEFQRENSSLVGVFYFNKGELFDAICGDLRGEEAALVIIGWENAEIRFRKLPKKKIRKQINSKLMPLIMEAMYRKDESAAQEEADSTDAESEELIAEGAAAQGKNSENQTTMQKGKETTVNIEKLNGAIEILKKDLGEGLIGTDIFSSADGQEIVSYNSNKKAAALFSQLTAYLGKALESAGFPHLGSFYMVDVADHQIIVVIPLGDYQWGVLLDKEKAPLGLFLNVVMPNIVDAFEEAIAG